LSPEAELAVATYARFRNNLRSALSACASGKELIQRGFSSDTELAAEYGVSRVAQVLIGDRPIDDFPK
jgi:2-phosphosulfolactate phosphatase